MSSEQLEMAMISLEDADDVNALRGAQKEAADELLEFDESIDIKKNSDAEDDDAAPADKAVARSKAKQQRDEIDDQKKEEEELEKEFAAWQDKVGMDASEIESSLSPTEKYGLRFREEIDPFYSIFAVMEYNRRIAAMEDKSRLEKNRNNQP